jgi:hypothetical protein
MKKILLITCLICSVVALGQKQQQKKTVVLHPSFGRSVDDDVKDMFMEALSEGFTKTGKYKVLEDRSSFDKVFGNELAFQESWVDDDSEQKIDPVMAAAADYALYAKIFQVGRNYKITYKMTNLKDEQGEVENPGSMSTKNGKEDLIEVSNKITEEIASGSQQKKLGVLCPNCCIDGDGYADCRISPNDERPMLWEEAEIFCRSKGEDWYLPSIEELQKIYDRQYDIVKYGSRKFQQKEYWSSSRYNNYDVQVVDFETGEATYANKRMNKTTFRCVKMQ